MDIKTKLNHPMEAGILFNALIQCEVEEFWAASLNSEKYVTATKCLFRGTLDHCLFHPRDVFRFAYENNAAAIVVAHNHPSGCLEPSPHDLAVTEHLMMAALILQMPVVDHLIVSQGNYFSFLQNGLLKAGPNWQLRYPG